jgi:hypothetical protein
MITLCKESGDAEWSAHAQAVVRLRQQVEADDAVGVGDAGGSSGVGPVSPVPAERDDIARVRVTPRAVRMAQRRRRVSADRFATVLGHASMVSSTPPARGPVGVFDSAFLLVR